MKCVRCGTELKEGEKVCLGCGFEVGKEYIPEVNETLESLMEMPEDEEEHEEIEEMEIEGVKKELDTINGEEVVIKNEIVGENKGIVKKKKKKNYLWIIVVVIVLIILICLYFVLMKEEEIVTPSKKDDKINVVNHPTETYIYDNRIMFRLNDLWSKNNDEYINDLSMFKILKYEFDINSIDNYLKYIGVDEKEEKEINNIKYYYVINDSRKEYVIVLKEKIYVFSFDNVNDDNINNILNTVKLYK